MAEATVVPEAAAIPSRTASTRRSGAHRLLRHDRGRGRPQEAQVPAGANVLAIGLGGVGLSLVMGAVLAGAARNVAVDRVAAKLDVAGTLGATDGLPAAIQRRRSRRSGT